jgi:RNA polymerase sigma factor (sigma-70 family)
MDFESFYKTLYSRVYKFFYYKSVNTADIEDLCNDSFLIFYDKYQAKLINTEESSKILFGICKNIYRRWIQKIVKETNNVDLEKFCDEISDEYEVFSQDKYEEKLEKQKILIKDAIEKLNPIVKEVMICRFVHFMTRAETAVKIGIKEKDVHTYQKRGVKYLRKIINEN